MSDLVFIAFDSEKKAEEVRDKVLGMQKEYLIEVSDAVIATRDENGRVKDGPLKDLVTTLAHAFHDWVDMIHSSRRLLAEDAAHTAEQAKDEAHA